MVEVNDYSIEEENPRRSGDEGRLLNCSLNCGASINISQDLFTAELLDKHTHHLRIQIVSQ